METTLILVKPRGVQKGLIGDMISSFERKGAKLLALKFLVASREQIGQHYIDHSTQPFFESLIDFMTSGPICPMVFDGVNIIQIGRNLIGDYTMPKSIRGKYDPLGGHGKSIHGADTKEAAKREINIWFSPNEIIHWNRKN